MIKVRTCRMKKNFAKIASAAYDLLKLEGEAVVDVDFCSREEIKELNARTRGTDRETDVLSYPFLRDAKPPFDEAHYPGDYDAKAGAVMLGCVAICDEYIKQAAAEDNTVYISDVYRAFAHAVLHLMGYDHVTDEQYEQMHAMENKILQKAGIIR